MTLGYPLPEPLAKLYRKKAQQRLRCLGDASDTISSTEANGSGYYVNLQCGHGQKVGGGGRGFCRPPLSSTVTNSFLCLLRSKPITIGTSLKWVQYKLVAKQHGSFGTPSLYTLLQLTYIIHVHGGQVQEIGRSGAMKQPGNKLRESVESY